MLHIKITTEIEADPFGSYELRFTLPKNATGCHVILLCIFLVALYFQWNMAEYRCMALICDFFSGLLKLILFGSNIL